MKDGENFCGGSLVEGFILDVNNGEEILNRLRNGSFEDSLAFDLRVRAEELSLCRGLGYLYSSMASKVKLLPHQVFTVYTVTNDMRGRALLADEVGLGKTIEACMILKELAFRNLVERVLVLVPSSLATQWRDELLEKFDEEFIIYNSKKREELEKEGGNIWSKNSKIICSIDTAKQEKHIEDIRQVGWDILIVDESHKLKNSETLRHRLVREVPSRFLLFLTATPLQNNLIELYNQVYLLDSKLLGSLDSFKMLFADDVKGLRPTKTGELKRRLHNIMLRTKRKDAIGVVFTRRIGESVLLDMSPEERLLYEEVTEYVKEAYSPQNAFVLMIFERMASSSSFAIRDSLEKRIDKLRRELTGEATSELDILEEEIDLEYEDVEDYQEESRNAQVIRKELERLQWIHKLAENISTNTKGEKLRTLLSELNLKQSGEKLLIFTEFRSTQSYLYDLLVEEGYSVAIFNGSLSATEKDEAVRSFRENRQIMISTEAGGEGRNLQFCHLMVNYDLPWNPMRVDQRIGRLHRIGQENDVKIFNFSYANTIEEYVLNLLQNKIKLFEEVIGELDLILGEISDNFELTIMKILVESANRQELIENIEKLGERIERARGQFQLLGELDHRTFRGFDMSVYKEIMNAGFDPLKEQNKIARFFQDYLRRKGLRFLLETPETLRFEASGGYDWFKDFQSKIQELLRTVEKEPISPAELSERVNKIIDEFLCLLLCEHPSMESCPKAYPDGCWVAVARDSVNWHLESSRLGLARRHIENMLSPRFQELVRENFQRFMRRVTFSPEVASREGIELVTFGSSLLEDAVRECLKAGFTARKLVSLSGHRLAGFEKYSGMVGVLFNFKVSFQLRDKEEQIIPILVDLGRMRHDEELSIEVNDLPSMDLVECDVSFENVEAAYRVALKTLRGKLDLKKDEVRKRAEREYNKQLEKIDSYYLDSRESLMMEEEEARNRVRTLLEKMRRSRESEALTEYQKQLDEAQRQLTRITNRNNRRREELMRERKMELEKLEMQQDVGTSIALVNSALVKIES